MKQAPYAGGQGARRTRVRIVPLVNEALDLGEFLWEQPVCTTAPPPRSLPIPTETLTCLELWSRVLQEPLEIYHQIAPLPMSRQSCRRISTFSRC